MCLSNTQDDHRSAARHLKDESSSPFGLSAPNQLLTTVTYISYSSLFSSGPQACEGLFLLPQYPRWMTTPCLHRRTYPSALIGDRLLYQLGRSCLRIISLSEKYLSCGYFETQATSQPQLAPKLQPCCAWTMLNSTCGTQKKSTFESSHCRMDPPSKLCDCNACLETDQVNTGIPRRLLLHHEKSFMDRLQRNRKEMKSAFW